METRSALVRRVPWPATIEGPSREAVTKELGRAFKAGELVGAGNLQRLDSGRWVAYVYRVKEVRKRRVPSRPVLVAGGAVLVLASAGAVGWWLASATVSAASALSLPLVVGGVAVLIVVRFAVRRSSGCTTTVTVTHRH